MIIESRTNKLIRPLFRKLSEGDLESLEVFSSGKWGMNWREPFWNDYPVYGLFVDNQSTRVEGLASFYPKKGHLYMFQLETAVYNRYDSITREYAGIGKHLVGLGCYLSNNKYSEITQGVLTAFSKPESREFYALLEAQEDECDWWVFDHFLTGKIMDECFAFREEELV
ncbi:hypothetical protein MOF32_27035 [Priestia megaterium]|uniref:hypothetical protein n=1 Tax=Priestia megaterium TaxID=1404 RepID=UPI00227E3984|nr:hypothetical protein [Priestia megaterium]MCY9026541.1 hypothetical protein [Priestia megaterium]